MTAAEFLKEMAVSAAGYGLDPPDRELACVPITSPLGERYLGAMRAEDAAQLAVRDAGKTLKHIKSIYIKNMEAVVKDNKIVQYRVNANITFELEP